MNQGIEIKVTDVDDAKALLDAIDHVLLCHAQYLGQTVYHTDLRRFYTKLSMKIRETDSGICTQLPYATNDLVKMINDLEKRVDSLKGDLKNIGRVFSRRFESNDARVQKKINDLKQRLDDRGIYS